MTTARTPGHPPPTAAVADALLTLGAPLRVAGGLTAVIPATRVAGPAHPVLLRGSVDTVLESLDAMAPGSVIVADDAGRTDRACVGDLLAIEAQAAGAAGLVVWGCHRDTTELVAIGLPVFSLGRHPAGPARDDPLDDARHPAARPVLCSHPILPGDHIVADDDGVIILGGGEVGAAFEEAAEIERTERRQAAGVRGGHTLRSQLAFDEYLERRAANPNFRFRDHLRQRGAAIER